MIWVLIITLLIKLIASPDQIFSIPKLPKEIKTHVNNKQRKDALLVIIKESKKDIKAFNKEKEKKKKKLKKLIDSDNNEISLIETILSENLSERKKLQSRLIENRLRTQDLMTDEEWTNVIERAVSPKAKAERKSDKNEDKLDKSINKLLEDIEKSVLKKMPDSPKRNKVISAFKEFSEALKTLIEKGIDVDFQNNSIVSKRTATKEELQNIYDKQNELRAEYYGDFFTMFTFIQENTNPKERKAIRKELKKMFK